MAKASHDPLTPAVAVTAPADTAIHVRRARPSDLETIVHLRMALLREHGTHPIYGRLRPDAERRARTIFGTQLASPGEVMFLAESGDGVVGILRCVESAASPLLDPPRYGYVSSVYVEPPARRRGVLRALLQAAERWCADRGIDEMRLHSVVDDTVSGGAWDAMGFEPVEVVRMKKL